MDWMAMADDHGRTQLHSFSYRRDRRQQQQAFDVSIVCAFDRVGPKDQMVPNPQRVKAIGFGAPRSVEAFFYGRVLAEMRQQQTKFKFCRHEDWAETG